MEISIVQGSRWNPLLPLRVHRGIMDADVGLYQTTDLDSSGSQWPWQHLSTGFTYKYPPAVSPEFVPVSTLYFSFFTQRSNTQPCRFILALLWIWLAYWTHLAGLPIFSIKWKSHFVSMAVTQFPACFLGWSRMHNTSRSMVHLYRYHLWYVAFARRMSIIISHTLLSACVHWCSKESQRRRYRWS